MLDNRGMLTETKKPSSIEFIAGMREAGRLASEVLDHVTPFVKAGVTTGELDRICHEYMVNVQKTVPAPLNYQPPGYPPFPKSICTSVNDVICHGIPGDRNRAGYWRLDTLLCKPSDVQGFHSTII